MKVYELRMRSIIYYLMPIFEKNKNCLALRFRKSPDTFYVDKFLDFSIMEDELQEIDIGSLLIPELKKDAFITVFTKYPQM